MDIEGLHQWLHTHFEQIHRFMDYTPFIQSDEILARSLSSWFNNPNWDDGTYRFVSLGKSFRGCQFIAWFRREDKPPHVVYVGSEGGRGVMTKTLDDWAKLIAHMPWIQEHPDFDGTPAQVVVAAVKDRKFESDEAKLALASYRAAVEEEFGAIPAWEPLLDGLDALNEEFCAWVESSIAPYVHLYSMRNMFTYKLTASPGSNKLRHAVGERLGFERANARQFLKLLNERKIPLERFVAAVQAAQETL